MEEKHAYAYTVRLSWGTEVQAGPEVTDELMDKVEPDAILSQPGRLEVTGIIESGNAFSAAETMRNVLGTVAYTLAHRTGVRVTGEGWDLGEYDDTEAADADDAAEPLPVAP